MKQYIKTLEAYDYKQHLKNLSQGKTGPIPLKKMADHDVNWNAVERSGAMQSLRDLGFQTTILKNFLHGSFHQKIMKTWISDEEINKALDLHGEDQIKTVPANPAIEFVLWSDGRRTGSCEIPGSVSLIITRIPQWH